MTRRREKANVAIGTRRAAREFVFRVMFEADRGKLPLSTAYERARADLLTESSESPFPSLNDDALAFAEQLMTGVREKWPEIDHVLRQTVRGWSFEQMAQTDLNVLRLATYEILYSGEPHPPLIESAVRIARKFGGDESGRFVNGVLAGLSRQYSPEEN